MKKITVPKHIDFKPRKDIEKFFEKEGRTGKVVVPGEEIDKFFEVLKKDEEYQKIKKNVEDIEFLEKEAIGKKDRTSESRFDQERRGAIVNLNQRYDILKDDYRQKISKSDKVVAP